MDGYKLLLASTVAVGLLLGVTGPVFAADFGDMFPPDEMSDRFETAERFLITGGDAGPV